MRLPVCAAVMLFVASFTAAECQHLDRTTAEWTAIDRQYATIETATFKKDPKLLFSVYAPDFEAHQFNGQVWKFTQSATYSTAAFDQVKENIALSNTILDLERCSAARVSVTVLQQWTRRQLSFGKVRLYQTATVQDETWELVGGQWLRKLVENERPGMWMVDLKRIDPHKPFDPEAPGYDPHGLGRSARN